ncbi:MAG: hypothetical protein IJY09_04490 [Lachnospiraceae bacterium]|nr:hypothetical protein [Lachnospiraceae bacterium]
MAGHQINITRRQFQESSKNHYLLYKNTQDDLSPRTRRLILFYAVECGLKSLIMKDLGKDNYKDFKTYSENNNLRIHTHDLKAMTREIGIEHNYPLKRIPLSKGNPVDSARFNELWRYGAEVEDVNDEIETEKTLQKIAEWIEQRL